jgi:hypothetical protein
LPGVRLLASAAAISDRVHRDKLRTAGAIEHLVEACICILGFLVTVSADKSVENLPTGEREIRCIFLQNALNLIEQDQRFGSR